MAQWIVKYFKYAAFALLFIMHFQELSAWERRSDSTFYLSASGGLINTSLFNHAYGARLIPQYGTAFSVQTYLKASQEFGFSAGFMIQSRKFQIDDVTPYYNESLELLGYAPAIYSLNYLSIPLKARYNFGRKINVYIEGGFQGNILLSAQRRANFDTIQNFTGDHADYIADIKQDHPNFSLSLIAGGGIEYFPKSNIALFAEYSYQRDITKLFVYDNLAGGVKPKMLAHGLQIGIRYGIPLRYSVQNRRRI
ncbi:MAG: outer membrane beta-barrel protein [Bacteroidales bacterium]|jgi:opacity protein-like surface antigen|nr:outer membrane beta-barrel protein [Bacteroidales bacterium]